MPEFRTSPSRSGTRCRSALIAVLLGSTLIGCAVPQSRMDLVRNEPTYLRMTEERAFAHALRQRYLELATFAYDRGDMERSDFFSLRAIMAVEGKLVEPMGFGKTIADPELDHALQRLNAALAGGVRLASPVLAARAQAAYDCWRVESLPGGLPEIRAACRQNMLTALAQLEDVGVGSRIQAAALGRIPHHGATRIVAEPGMPPRHVEAGGMHVEVATSGTAPRSSTARRIVRAPMTRVAPQAVPARYVSVGTLDRAAQQVGIPAAPSALYVESAPAPRNIAPAPAPMPYAEAVPQGYLDTGPLIREVAPPTDIELAIPYAQPEPGYGPQVEYLPEAGPVAPVPSYAPMVEVPPAIDIAPAPAFEVPPAFDIAPAPAFELAPAIEIAPVPLDVPIYEPAGRPDAPTVGYEDGRYVVVEPPAPPAPSYVDEPSVAAEPPMEPVLALPDPLSARERPVYAQSVEPPMNPGERAIAEGRISFDDGFESASVDMGAMAIGSGDALSALIDMRKGLGDAYAVYFGFDSSTITPEAEDALIDVIERIELRNASRVSLAGLTDSAGDARYNQLLAMRRANAVRNFINENTSRRIDFEMLPVGEAEAVRDGGDGVDEALNRRVEIRIE